MKAIKNYRSTIAINKIFEQLQLVLVKHGAKQITFDYGQDGKIYGVTFGIEVPGKTLIVRLPARVENVHAILENQRESGLIRNKLDPERWYVNDAVAPSGVLPKASFGIFYYNLDTLQIVSEKPFANTNGIDEFGWPSACGNASPGGEADIIINVVIDKTQVCSGEPIKISVETVHPELASNPVSIPLT